jgi:gluconate 2-dehydrogenase gamma chain
MTAEGPTKIGRRGWIQAAALVLGGGVVFALARRSAPRLEPLATLPSAARPRSFAPQLFSAEQALLVEDLAEYVIPETELPGALGVGVPAYIEDIVREVYDEPQRLGFLRALDAIQAELRAGGGRDEVVTRGLAGCGPSFETGEPWCFFQALRALCIEGFCQSEIGATRLLQYESVPGQFRGCVPLREVGRAWATS